MEEDNFSQIKSNPAEQRTHGGTCVGTLCVSMFAGVAMRASVKTSWKTRKRRFVRWRKRERGRGFFLHTGGSTVRNYKIPHRFWLEEEFESAENLVRRLLVEAGDWGQPVFSPNKGARCPSVSAAWVTWRMWLASRHLSASWTGSDIRRCHRAVHANFSYLTFSICAVEQTLPVQFTGLRGSGDVTNGVFAESNTNARGERASCRGEFVNKIHKSWRHYALLQLFWLSRALFEGMEQDKWFCWADPAISTTSAIAHLRVGSDSGGGEDNCFLCFTRKLDYRRQIIAAITGNGAVSWTPAPDGTSRMLRYFVDTVEVVWCRAKQWIFFLLIRQSKHKARSVNATLERSKLCTTLKDVLYWRFLMRNFPKPPISQLPILSVGADNIKKYWSRYYQGSQGVVFVLDSASSDEDLEAARNELHSALQHPQLCTLPFLILANHQDKPAARTPNQVMTDSIPLREVTRLGSFQDLSSCSWRSPPVF